jgi:hypothetical protein
MLVPDEWRRSRGTLTILANLKMIWWLFSSKYTASLQDDSRGSSQMR